jgi:HEAT repeat protein
VATPSARELRANTESSARPGEVKAHPSQLGERLRAEEDPSARGEIISALWEIATPEAVETLRRHFFIEREPDVKTDIVAGLAENQRPDTRELRFGILSAALASAQPEEVRLAAIGLATEFDDIRAVALLQNLAQDPSEEIREAAKEALEARADK